MVDLLLTSRKEDAHQLVLEQYLFIPIKVQNWSCFQKGKMKTFRRDGFIDRYSGRRRVNPGLLKSITVLFFWWFSLLSPLENELLPEGLSEFIPHNRPYLPIARCGADSSQNWITTSMRNNSIKSNWTVEELGWNRCVGGNLLEWDGLTEKFLQLVGATPQRTSWFVYL